MRTTTTSAIASSIEERCHRALGINLIDTTSQFGRNGRILTDVSHLDVGTTRSRIVAIDIGQIEVTLGELALLLT